MVNRINVTSMSNKHSGVIKILLFLPVALLILLNKGRWMQNLSRPLTFQLVLRKQSLCHSKLHSVSIQKFECPGQGENQTFDLD